jgi:hypothetical protein
MTAITRYAANVLFAALGVVVMASLAAGAGVGSAPSVTVQEKEGLYSVSATFRVSEPPARVLEILTAYDEIPSFMPQIKLSRILDREAGRIVVEQQAESGMLTFKKQMHLILEVTQAPDGLHFRDRCGRSFGLYEGTWRIVERDGGSDVTYELTAKPTFGVPEFLLKRVLKRDSARMIAQLQNRMAVR